MEIHANGNPCTKFVVPSREKATSYTKCVYCRGTGGIPIGSTQKIGPSVSSGNFPWTDVSSSPILNHLQ